MILPSWIHEHFLITYEGQLILNVNVHVSLISSNGMTVTAFGCLWVVLP